MKNNDSVMKVVIIMTDFVVIESIIQKSVCLTRKSCRIIAGDF